MPKSNKDNAPKTGKENGKRELCDKRSRQLTDAHNALKRLEADREEIYQTQRRLEALVDHSGGFYAEMSQLAKGKTLLPITDLMLDEANNIIRDAKEIVTNDVYLDRMKEFVPAGDNPVYPDVVVRIRSIRDTLSRFRKSTEGQLGTINAKLHRARTLIGALEFFLDDEVEVEDQDEKNYPSKEALEDYVRGTLSDSCLSYFADSDEKYFDFEKVDAQTIEDYLLVDKAMEHPAKDNEENLGQAEGDEEDEDDYK